jgi:hypothetical protein
MKKFGKLIWRIFQNCSQVDYLTEAAEEKLSTGKQVIMENI